MTMTVTYEETADRYRAVMSLRRRVEATLLSAAPGTERGRVLYERLRTLEAAEANARQQVLDHPDAPPQG